MQQHAAPACAGTQASSPPVALALHAFHWLGNPCRTGQVCGSVLAAAIACLAPFLMQMSFDPSVSAQAWL